MPPHAVARLRLVVTGIVTLAMALGITLAAAAGQIAHAQGSAGEYRDFCEYHPASCVDTAKQSAYYVGHDEPSALFYSNVPGSGNSNLYQLALPEDPPVLPRQNGSGGTFNFQLHPAF